MTCKIVWAVNQLSLTPSAIQNIGKCILEPPTEGSRRFSPSALTASRSRVWRMTLMDFANGSQIRTKTFRITSKNIGWNIMQWRGNRFGV
jgi:hypothetical protein